LWDPVKKKTHTYTNIVEDNIFVFQHCNYAFEDFTGNCGGSQWWHINNGPVRQ
jgi:hypothetical protein